MSNSNRVLIGILTFIVVCVIGYALFSDTITVTGIATASGDFSVESSCTKGYSSILQTTFGVTQNEGQGGYREDTCSVSGTTLSADVLLDYPSANRIFTFEIVNSGSIPLETDLREILDETTLCAKDPGVAEDCWPTADLPDELKAYYYSYNFAGVVTSAGNHILSDEDEGYAEHIIDDNIIRLNENDKMLFLVKFNWTETDEVQEEYTKTNLSLKLNFEQVAN